MFKPNPINKMRVGDPLSDEELADGIQKLQTVMNILQWLEAPEYRVGYSKALHDYEALRSYQTARRR